MCVTVTVYAVSLACGDTASLTGRLIVRSYSISGARGQKPVSAPTPQSPTSPLHHYPQTQDQHVSIKLSRADIGYHSSGAM